MAKAQAENERPILVLSNRLPFTVHRGSRGLEQRPSAGGLVSALEPVLRKRGGTWIGWPGIELQDKEQLELEGAPYRVAPVRITEKEATRYYHGFSNRTLWPLFHSLHERARFDRRDWETYRRVNQRFADAAVSAYSPGDIAWVHDYHLMLTPQQMRLKVPDAQIAFFLHIPFPPYDIFRLLPWEEDLLWGLLACDVIGFHVSGYAHNFLDCVERRLGARVDRENMLVEHGDRTVQIGSFPIGIEFDLYEKQALDAPPSKEVRHERIVLGVDRLDYTKGIPERIRAFERLLELYPDYREEVVLLQIAVPSRSQVAEYKELKREIDELVGRVNGRFATSSWSPIRYLYRAVPQDRLAGLYRDAHVALVTPLRDGMNLVAKEYVTCQVEDPGVLVLSRLAGAAETMHEALLVNPYNPDECAEAMHRALSMDEAERGSRVAALRRRERRYNVDFWVRSFLTAAAEDRQTLRPASHSEFETWLGAYLSGYQCALFLDYDGTLTPIVDHPSKALLADSMRSALEACAERADTDVAIVSGRKLEDVRSHVTDPRLTYAGNHGLEVSGPDLPPFRHEDLVHYLSRTDDLAKELERLGVEGAWTERKGPTLTFHYRKVAEPKRDALIEEARSLIIASGFQARDAHCAVEARPPIGWDKGRAVLHILRSRYGRAWSERVRVIYVGDDLTDEDAFRLLAGLAITFRVGPADVPTAASRQLPNVDAVKALVEWVGQRETFESHTPRLVDA